MRGLLLVAVVLSWATRAHAGEPEPVPGEVALAGAADVAALCEELREGSRDAARGLYVVVLPSSSWSFAPYDKKRARLAIDLKRGVRSRAYELVLGQGAGGLDVALPVSAREAARLIKEGKSAELRLWLWFRPAALPGQDGRSCLEVHSAQGGGVRLGVAPLGFALLRAGEPLAAGETAELSELRAEAEPAAAPVVSVGAVVVTGEDRPAPAALRAATPALARALDACSARGLAVEPRLRGTLVMGFGVTADGKVSAARVELDGLGAPEVAACAVARVKAWKLPSGVGGRYSAPLVFGR
jgi:hypothetical protein